jgi:hypothetical protein
VQFHYPAAAFQGRDAIRSFWTLFLLQRALQRIDVTSTRFDASWDPAKLRLHVSIETWQHSTPLAWLDKLLPVPVWKVGGEGEGGKKGGLKQTGKLLLVLGGNVGMYDGMHVP